MVKSTKGTSSTGRFCCLPPPNFLKSRPSKNIISNQPLPSALQPLHNQYYTKRENTRSFDPGPQPFPRIPIYLAAVTPPMLRVAGEVCDGVHVHPVTRRPIHVDLFAVDLTQEMQADIPLVFAGTSPAWRSSSCCRAASATRCA